MVALIQTRYDNAFQAQSMHPFHDVKKFHHRHQHQDSQRPSNLYDIICNGQQGLYVMSERYVREDNMPN